LLVGEAFERGAGGDAAQDRRTDRRPPRHEQQHAAGDLRDPTRYTNHGGKPNCANIVTA